MAPQSSQERGPRVIYWAGVLNNPSQTEIEALQQLDQNPEVREGLVCEEEAPTTGTPHLHIYVALRKSQRLTWLKSLSDRAHWEPVRNRPATLAYTRKAGRILFDNVQQKESSQRQSHLQPAVELLQSQGLLAVAREQPCLYVQHYRGLQALESAWLSGRDKPVPRISWFWGSTGSGKTRAAMTRELSQDNIYKQCGPAEKGDKLWWDGYRGQKRVVLDDFRPWWCNFTYLLNLLDRYPISVPIKGGFVNFIPEEIIITCPYPIEEMFTTEYRSQEDIQQIRRRVHHIEHFVKVDDLKA